MAVWIARQPTRARVHCCNELELSRILMLVSCAVYQNMAGLKRLAQLIQNSMREFRELIEEKHAAVSQSNFAR